MITHSDMTAIANVKLKSVAGILKPSSSIRKLTPNTVISENE